MRTQSLTQYEFGISKDEDFKPSPSVVIIFTDEDLATIKLPHADPLIIKLRIEDAIVSQVLVDGGSSSDVIFWSALRRIRVVEELIRPTSTHIYVFNGTKVNPIGTIDLSVYVADRVLIVKFFVVDTQSTVNTIMGWEWIHSIRGMVLTLHQELMS